jgi:uncharacterized cupredoxin-like copper-binding protein
MRKLLLAAGLAVAATGLSAPAWADATVHIELADVGGQIDFSKNMGLGADGKGDMKIAPVSLKADATSVPAGKVTFEVMNNSKEIEHEMVVAPIASMDAAPPFKADENEVDEDTSGAVGEVPELEPGKSGSVTLDLKPGYYILFCNVAGHYGAGMWAKFEVK